jgi:diaminopimelate decarboxylase
MRSWGSLTHRDRSGNLLLGGIPAATLAKCYGTPALVVDLDGVDAAIAELLDCAADAPLEISYAAKAFTAIEFLRHVMRHPIGIDVCSIGELVTAERAGVAPERLTLHGAGKSEEELRAARDGRVGTIVVDGIEELETLAKLSRDACRADVLLRLNVGVDARTHAFVRTGGDDSKFGIHARDEDAAAMVLRNNPPLRFNGVHAHIGSQIFDTAAYLATATALLEGAQRFSRHRLTAGRIIIGGGFGVRTHSDQGESLNVRETIAAVTRYVAKWTSERGLPTPRLGIEPGRAIVAGSGTTLYRVLAVKRQTTRTFVVIDGGIAENPRPALYGARHEVIAVSPLAGAQTEMTLCGRSCENDELGTVHLPRGVRSGDLLAMHATGAYTYSMAGNYNRFPRPAVVGVAGNSHRLLVRRESIDDVLGKDIEGRPQAAHESGERAAAF